MRPRRSTPWTWAPTTRCPRATRPASRTPPNGPRDRREYNGPTTTSTVTPQFPALTAVKTAPNGPIAYIDDEFAWRFEVTNSGGAGAFDVDLVDTLPPNWRFVPGSASVAFPGVPVSTTDPTLSLVGDVQTLTWTDKGDLAVGQTVIVTFRAKPLAAAVQPPPIGSAKAHTNSVQATADDATGASSNLTGPVPVEPGHGGCPDPRRRRGDRQDRRRLRGRGDRDVLPGRAQQRSRHGRWSLRGDRPAAGDPGRVVIRLRGRQRVDLLAAARHRHARDGALRADQRRRHPGQRGSIRPDRDHRCGRLERPERRRPTSTPLLSSPRPSTRTWPTTATLRQPPCVPRLTCAWSRSCPGSWSRAATPPTRSTSTTSARA